MLGPQHVPSLIKFFDGVDAALSLKLLRPTAPDELALTNELCALMDERVQREEGLLKEFNIDALNAALADFGDDTKFEFRIDTHPHNPVFENKVSQADLGLVLEYHNEIIPEDSWSSAYLLQAKRLHRADKTGEYDERASFASVDVRQHERLCQLAKIFGNQYFRYILYCPPVSRLTPRAATKIRAPHSYEFSNRFNRHYFHDFQNIAEFLFCESYRKTGRIDAGIWLYENSDKPRGLMELHHKVPFHAKPFSWFLVQQFLATGCYQISYGHNQRIAQETDQIRKKAWILEHEKAVLIQRVASGNKAGIDEFLRRVHKAGTPDLPEITILPKYTLTIRATVGSSLPPDFRRAIVQE
jgi:hypothetical protein